MAYSTDIAEVLVNQLARLTSLNRHQLAGQVANLDFWLKEVLHCLAVIDDYPQRFRRLRCAQASYVSTHKTTTFYPGDPGTFDESAPSPLPVRDVVLKDSRQALNDAAYRFLRRCFDEGLLEETGFQQACEDIGTSIDYRDLRRRQGST